MLFTNELVPGQKLSYRTLAERMKMSLTPVIQALKQLEHQGLVQYETNRGYFTAPMRVQEVEEIFELRELIEISLLPAVIDNINNKSLRQLEDIMAEKEDCRDDDSLNRRLFNDRRFHMEMAAISGRRIQVQMLEHLFDLLYLKYRGSLLFVASHQSVGSMHGKLLTALGDRDLQKTRQILKSHFKTIKSQAVKALNAMITETP